MKFIISERGKEILELHNSNVTLSNFFGKCLATLDEYFGKNCTSYKTPGNFVNTHYGYPPTKYFPCCKDGATFSVYLTQILIRAWININDTNYTIYDNNDNIVWKYPGYATRSRKTN